MSEYCCELFILQSPYQSNSLLGHLPRNNQRIVSWDAIGKSFFLFHSIYKRNDRPSGDPLGNPSPTSPIPWGGASVISTTTFDASSLHSIFNASASAAVLASHASPPPVADNPSRCCLILLLDVKPKFWVTKVRSCGGWSRKAIRPKRMSPAEREVEEDILEQMDWMASLAESMYGFWLPVASCKKTMSLQQSLLSQ